MSPCETVAPEPEFVALWAADKVQGCKAVTDMLPLCLGVWCSSSGDVLMDDRPRHRRNQKAQLEEAVRAGEEFMPKGQEGSDGQPIQAAYGGISPDQLLNRAAFTSINMR